jgi:hypothetical protein
MKKKFAKYLIPKRAKIRFSSKQLIESFLEKEDIWDTDDTNGFPHEFTALYKLVSVKKAKKK